MIGLGSFSTIDNRGKQLKDQTDLPNAWTGKFGRFDMFFFIVFLLDKPIFPQQIFSPTAVNVCVLF